MPGYVLRTPRGCAPGRRCLVPRASVTRRGRDAGEDKGRRVPPAAEPATLRSVFSSIAAVNRAIVGCERCARLRTYCRRVARDKKPEFSASVYWGLPVPGFGDSSARLLVVGLAAAAHGANRTGRMFTGDSSGRWLYEALYRYRFASASRSVSRDVGRRLRDCYSSAAG